MEHWNLREKKGWAGSQSEPGPSQGMSVYQVSLWTQPTDDERPLGGCWHHYRIFGHKQQKLVLTYASKKTHVMEVWRLLTYLKHNQEFRKRTENQGCSGTPELQGATNRTNQLYPIQLASQSPARIWHQAGAACLILDWQSHQDQARWVALP